MLIGSFFRRVRLFSDFAGSAVLRVPRDQENKESRATIQPRISTPCAVDTETDATTAIDRETSAGWPWPVGRGGERVEARRRIYSTV